jgi:hypothetical protein
MPSTWPLNAMSPIAEPVRDVGLVHVSMWLQTPLIGLSERFDTDERCDRDRDGAASRCSNAALMAFAGIPRMNSEVGQIVAIFWTA